MSQRGPDLDATAINDLVRRALEEDIGTGDVTSESLIPSTALISASIVAREDCVVSGVSVASSVFCTLDPDVTLSVIKTDGEVAAAGDTIMEVHGSGRSILTGERVALNFMQRMCGIATQTAAFVEAIKPHDTRILDTRKTTPTLRAIEKYAVTCGGGTNHRMGLYDRVMVKDNHREFLGSQTEFTLSDAVNKARAAHPDILIQVEVETLSDLVAVLESNPDWVLLDNMSPTDVAECVRISKGRTKLEASGGITLRTIASYAATGVDAISLGCLTHSVQSTDLSLDYQLIKSLT